MHPQLDTNRFDTCEKLVEALEQCHNTAFIKKVMGVCNFEKDELNKCLHVTRVEDSKARIRVSREKQKRILDLILKEGEDVYGKNGYLKKVVELEMKRRASEKDDSK